MTKHIILNTDEIKALQNGSTMIVRPIDFKNIYKQSGCSQGKLAYSSTFKSWAVFNGNGDAHLCLVDCPYGKVDDELIVKEKFNCWFWDDVDDAAFEWTALTKKERRQERFSPSYDIAYAANDDPIDPDSENPDWAPASQMPKEFSRYTLKITGVRIKRCQEITEEEALSAGFDTDMCKKIFVNASKGVSVVDEYWIDGVDGIVTCESYCKKCAMKKAGSSEHVRFGGNCESDGPPFCDECGAPLDMSLTSYGVSNELRLCDEDPEKYFPCSGSDAAVVANISSGMGDLQEEYLGRLAQIGCATHLANRFAKKGFSWENNDYVWIIEHERIT
jgi:hypothetical protein